MKRLALIVFFLGAAAGFPQGVLHVDASPHAKLKSVPVRAVKMGEGFWAPRMRVNIERSIPSLLQLLEEHGVMDNFRRLSGRKQAPRRGPLYTDSDLYKWIEAAAFVLQSEDRPQLRAQIDALVDDIVAAQEPSGYLNTYYVDERVKLRWQEMQRGHELYCLGHMLQAAIAYYRAGGSRKLLDAGIRFVDHLVEDFGPAKRPLLTGHPEFELAVSELYRVTRDPRHLELARYLLSGAERERLKLRESELRYMFSGRPFTERTQLEGHSVRAMYAASGATDYYLETGDAACWKTLEGLWRDMVTGKMYLTGGVGSRSAGEAFGEAYELPNRQAYTESCAAIGSMMWNWRMLAATGEARFADVIERALYNGINSGMSLDGTLYCYRNPLELGLEKIRNPWYDTTCCPPNLQRTLASLPGYMYSTSAEGVYVHLYHSSVLDWHLGTAAEPRPSGSGLRLEQKTRYPWQGRVEITVTPAEPRDFTVFLRIPGWSPGAAVAVNGQLWKAAVRAGEYLPVRRKWQAGDRIALTLEVTARLTAANPRLAGNAGRVAVEWGPLVYAAEQVDQQGVPLLFDAALVADARPRASWKPELLGGVVLIEHRGAVYEKPLAEEPLYQSVAAAGARRTRPATLRLIPYYTFANRGPTEMQVWMRYEPAGR
ncbi:MAG: glycoside hydrolase family 127 protein [Acidobacteria bacterium]|nr:glycoside hydrolase family 127 protein [Acidobacteriota bacterium]